MARVPVLPRGVSGFAERVQRVLAHHRGPGGGPCTPSPASAVVSTVAAVLLAVAGLVLHRCPNVPRPTWCCSRVFQKSAARGGRRLGWLCVSNAARAYVKATEDRAAEAERTRREAARVEERVRIAREVHVTSLSAVRRFGGRAPGPSIAIPPRRRRLSPPHAPLRKARLALTFAA